jgi:SAM-dependent methyltransferase
MCCPLCGSQVITFYADDQFRSYLQCGCCQLIFADPKSYLSASEEKSRYDLHQNNPLDQNYRNFLGRTFEPVKARINSEANGLDFGAGPGPTLSLMFEESGHQMAIYDLYYANDPSVLVSKFYDFVTCTEVLEHIANPQSVIPMLLGLLKPGGLLAFMTKLCLGKEYFHRWHYKKDPTHICFYSKETFEFVANRYNCHLEFVGDDVIILSPNE